MPKLRMNGAIFPRPQHASVTCVRTNLATQFDFCLQLEFSLQIIFNYVYEFEFLILVYFFFIILSTVYFNTDFKKNHIRDEERVLRSVLQNDLLPFKMQLCVK